MVVIEEVGLIELSTELSLKVLHGLLDKRNVAFVGLTNWVLDQAKMNRSVNSTTSVMRIHVNTIGDLDNDVSAKARDNRARTMGT